MAKARKQRINRLNKKDREINLLMSKGGLIPKTEILKYISKTRMEGYCWDRYWKEETYVDNNNNRIEACRFTVEGRRFAEKEWGFDNHTNTKDTSLGHDIKLGEVAATIKDKESIESETDLWSKYYSIMDSKQKELDELEGKRLDNQLSQQERDHYAELWERKQHAYDRIEELKENGGISAPDIAATNEQGEYVCYEVITGNYGQAELNAKTEFANLIGAKIEFIRA